MLSLLTIAAGCAGTSSIIGPPDGDSPDGGTSEAGVGAIPRVLFNAPLDGTSGVPLNEGISATFTQPMDYTTLTSSTFTVTSGADAVPVQGTVIYANSKATFWPSAYLAPNRVYTATVTTGAKSAEGVPLAANHSWGFGTGTDVATDLPVNLGTAGNFVLLAKSGVSTVPTSAITGNIGVSPAAASYITGFSLTADPTNVFATSAQVTGKIYAADYAAPTPSNMTTTISDMELAYTEAASRAPDATELGAGNIGGMTLPAGVYKWGTGLLIPTGVTLNGSSTAVWIFQIAKDLTMASATNLTLTGGAQAKNVFWQVAGRVEIGTTSHLEGIVMSQTSISLNTGASIKGRLFAQTAVSIDGSVVVDPGL